MKIILRTLENGEEHPCGVPTIGDWMTWSNGHIEATVSQLNHPDHEFVVLLHEAFEAYACRKRGITAQEVTDFDRIFENEREQGLHSDTDEPGDDPRAPYRKEHQAATIIEMLALHMLGGSWPDHCRDIAEISS